MQPQYQPGPQYTGMPQMPMPKKGMNGLLIPFVVAVLLLITFVGLFVWALASMQDYKTNSDKKVATAVEVAKQQVSSAKDKEFIEKEKSPAEQYTGPAAYGTVHFEYPKKWSAYVDESSSVLPVNGYFHPSFVPGLNSGTAFALRVQVTNTKYAEELRQFDARVKAGKVTVKPYQPANVKEASALGVRIDGEIDTNKQGSMVIFPLRDKTIKVSTEATQFVGDFDNFVLKSLTFVP